MPTSPVSTAIKTYGVNSAPLKPLIDLSRRSKETKLPTTRLNEQLKEKFTYYSKHEEPIWRDIYAAAQLIDLFIQGKQLLRRHPNNGSWMITPMKNEAMEKRCINQMRFWENALVSKWVLSKPNIVVRPGSNNDKANLAARAATTVTDFYEERIYTTEFDTRDCKLGLRNGTWINRFRMDDSVESIKGLRSIIENKTITIGDGFGYCAECETQGSAEMFEPNLDSPIPSFKCPNCGKHTSDVHPPAQAMARSVSGTEEVKQGEIVCDQLPLQACRWNLMSRPEESSWFIYQQKTSLAAIRRLLGPLELKGSGDDIGLDILDKLAYVGMALSGHALHIDTPIITPNGWTEIWMLRAGDTVFSETGEPCKVVNNFEIMLERPCYEVEFSDGSTIIADEDHQWHTFNYYEVQQFRTRTLEWRLARHPKRTKERKINGGKRPDNAVRGLKKLHTYLPPPSGGVRTTKEIAQTLRFRKRYNHSVLVSAPLQFEAKQYGLDPYHLGLWLGDGTTGSGQFTTADDALWQAFAPTFEVHKLASKYSYGVHGLRTALVQVGVFGNKHIPREYLQGSVDQRLGLLQGLMDTDGHCGTKGYCEFTTTSPVLRDGFLELLSSLGIKFGITFVPSHLWTPSPALVAQNRHKRSEYNASDKWRIQFTTHLPAFRLARKLKRQQSRGTKRNHGNWRKIVSVKQIASVPVCCIEVDSPSHCYLAGRTMIPTHNSIGGDRKPEIFRQPVKVEEMSLGPDELVDIKLDKEEETVSGQPIPAGVSFDKLYPNGAIICGLNDMSVITGIYPETHREYIVSGYWHMNPNSGAGQGVGDGVEVQKRANTFDTQVIAGLQAGTTPGFLYIKGVMDENEARYLSDPRVAIPIDWSLLPNEAKDLRKLVAPAFTPATMPGQMLQYIQGFLNNQFQSTFGVTEFSGGLPMGNIKSDTFGAAKIAQATSQAISTPTLNSKAYTRKRGAEIVIDLFKRCMPIPRWFPMKGKFGREEFKQFAGIDVQGELRFEVVANSEMTKTIYDIRQDMNEFYAQFGGLIPFLEARKAYPRQVADLAKKWNVEIEDEDYDAISGICTKRIDQMRQGLQQTQDPAELIQFIRPPISTREPQLDIKSQWLQEWLDTDDGQESPMPLRLAVELVIEGQFTSEGMLQAALAGRQGMVEAAGAAPQAIGQKMLEGSDQQQEPPPQESPDARLKVEADAQNAERQSAESEAGRLHEAGESAAQRKHEADIKNKELEMKRLELKSKEKVASKQRSVARASA